MYTAHVNHVSEVRPAAGVHAYLQVVCGVLYSTNLCIVHPAYEVHQGLLC